jgi:hypothetical protein
MHENQATVGLDEMDILFGTGRAKSVLRSLLNAGYRKKGATWTRAGKDEKCIFGPVVMAGLGKTWRASDDLKALRSRTITVTMVRGAAWSRRTGRGPRQRSRRRCGRCWASGRHGTRR